MGNDDAIGSGAPTWTPQELPDLAVPPTPVEAPAHVGPRAPYGAPTYPTGSGHPAAPAYSAGPSYPAAPGYPAAPSYAAGPLTYAPPPARTPVIAIVGFVLAFVFSPAGLIVSLIALPRTRRAGAGRGLAIAGIAISMLPVIAAIAIPIYFNWRTDADDGPRGAFQAMQSALVERDCISFLVSTTEHFQQITAVTSCESFDNMVAAVSASSPGFGRVPITDVEIDGDTAVVSTVERTRGPDGEEIYERFDYRLVRVEGRWLVDDFG